MCTNALNTIVSNEFTWIDALQPICVGLFHSFDSHLSVLMTHVKDNQIAEEVLGEEVKLGYSFADSKLSILAIDCVAVEDLSILDKTVTLLKDFANRCNLISSHAINPMRIRSQRASKMELLSESANPLKHSLKDAVASVSKAKMSLISMCDKIASYQKKVMFELQQRRCDIDALQILMFTKEKERISALALVSCQACGWLRLGSAQKIGQRGLLHSVLWPNWSVLRRLLLILYSDPQQVSQNADLASFNLVCC